MRNYRNGITPQMAFRLFLGDIRTFPKELDKNWAKNGRFTSESNRNPPSCTLTMFNLFDEKQLHPLFPTNVHVHLRNSQQVIT
ncbi:Uncharacterized protein APZ42_019050 [Daphnia magna]|uniref:Uncharacterized protein n=1 Tax=Daphnia magna TaxID=35525 RepID=A0A164YLL4_9CRUS|nr:Uncharacterized protein APZ42_019050 [Daphnia magna]